MISREPISRRVVHRLLLAEACPRRLSTPPASLPPPSTATNEAHDEQKQDGTCDLRDKAACSLDSYLSLVLDAVEEVNERRRSRGVSLG